MSYKYFKNKKKDKGLYCEICGNKKDNIKDDIKDIVDNDDLEEREDYDKKVLERMVVLAVWRIQEYYL